MANTKVMIRFYTIADFIEEEIWLREEHRSGWKLTGMVPPCFYHFEACEPEDVIYKLDYKNNAENEDYMQMLRDYGWEYLGHCFGWLYFRKPAAEVTVENEGELFSDNTSRSEMLTKVIKTRILPLTVIFLCCVIPNGLLALDGSSGAFFTIFWMVLFAFYVYLLVHCGLKLRKMKEELK